MRKRHSQMENVIEDEGDAASADHSASPAEPVFRKTGAWMCLGVRV